MKNHILRKIYGAMYEISILPQYFLNKKLHRLYDQAEALVQSGQYEQALKNYVFVFERSRNISGWGGVRLSYVLSAMQEMCEKYPQSLETLKKLRDERATAIKSGNHEFDIIHEWSSLNEYLPDSDLIQFYDDLKASQPDLLDVFKEIRDLEFERFVELKRYSEFTKTEIQTKVWLLTQLISAYNPDSILYENKTEESRQDLIESGRKSILRDAGNVYECALALELIDECLAIKRILSKWECSVEMYLCLINAARKVSNNVALLLCEQAGLELQPSDLEPITKVEFNIRENLQPQE